GMALETSPRVFEDLPLGWFGTMPGPALRFGLDLLRGDRFAGPIRETQHLGYGQGVVGDLAQRQHGQLLSRAVRQIPATFLRQGAVAMASQCMRMLKELIEHGRTSRVTGSAGGSTVTGKVMWRSIARCGHVCSALR